MSLGAVCGVTGRSLVGVQAHEWARETVHIRKFLANTFPFYGIESYPWQFSWNLNRTRDSLFVMRILNKTK